MTLGNWDCAIKKETNLDPRVLRLFVSHCRLERPWDDGISSPSNQNWLPLLMAVRLNFIFPGSLAATNHRQRLRALGLRLQRFQKIRLDVRLEPRPCDTSAMLCYCVNNKARWIYPCGLVARRIQHCTGITRSQLQILCQGWFFRFRSQLLMLIA